VCMCTVNIFFLLLTRHFQTNRYSGTVRFAGNSTGNCHVTVDGTDFVSAGQFCSIVVGILKTQQTCT